MSIWKPLRILYLRSTDYTHGYQESGAAQLLKFYRLWAPFYDLSVRLDPAYLRQLKNMVDSTVRPGDITIDIGCGTGLSTIYAASIAKKVTGVDPSHNMLAKLAKKIRKRNIKNIEIKYGYFPNVLKKQEKFDTVISSFMLAHLSPEERKHLIADTFACLKSGGRLGLFSAQGEIASTFPTGEEIKENLSLAGFQDIKVNDVSDIYRISTAVKR